MRSAPPQFSTPISASLASARAAHLCATLANGLVEPQEALRRVVDRLEDLDATPPLLLDCACLDAVSELLVRLVQEGGGNRHACRDRLVTLWLSDVTRWCRWMSHSRQPADDIAQEVLVVLFTDVDRVRDPAQLRRWLHSVAWRKVRANHRRAWFRLRSYDEPHDDQVLSSEGPEQVERMELVERTLDAISQEQRVLLRLVYVEGRSRKDTADLLGMAEGTINRKLSRARADFAKAARRAGLEPGQAPDRGGAG